MGRWDHSLWVTRLSVSHDRPVAARGTSRLVREDENDKSDEEEEDEELGTITFGSKKEPRKQMQVREGEREREREREREGGGDKEGEPWLLVAGLDGTGECCQ